MDWWGQQVVLCSHTLILVVADDGFGSHSPMGLSCTVALYGRLGHSPNNTDKVVPMLHISPVHFLEALPFVLFLSPFDCLVVLPHMLVTHQELELDKLPQGRDGGNGGGTV